MADGSAIKGSEDAMQRCNELESELAELRVAYDQYFLGNERLPPQKKHDGFKKQYMKLKSSSVRQTAAKFRIESIGQKLLTFERLWDRTLQQIEAGTYKRDVMRMKRHLGQKKGSADADFDVDEDLDLSDLDEGGDDLASALAAAEAAATARAAAPAIKPVAPVAPVVAALKPAVAPPAGLQPLTAPIPAPKPSGPPKLTAAIPTPGFKPVSSGAERPVITAANPVLKPVPSRVEGPAGSPVSNPAIRPPTAAPAALRPAAVNGSSPALKPAGSAPPRPPTAGGHGEGGLSDTKVKAIYDAYLMAKKRCGEDTRAVTLDSVASSLRKQVPELMKTHNAKTVEFKVVIKDGKAVLRALPKE